MEYPNKRSEVEITLDSVHAISKELIAESPDVDTIKRNVSHLQLVKSGSYIDLDQFSAAQIASIKDAISSGNTFVSSL
jgi:anti-sigma28 factor (negative regulator of flagellin synthesis)